MIKTCVECGVEFFANHGCRKTCSYKCKRKRDYFGVSGKIKEPHLKNCLTCGVELVVPHNSRIKKYCSTNCREKYRRRKQWENASTELRLKVKISDRIRKAFKFSGNRKSKRTTELLGCDVKTAKKWLEDKFLDGMNWGNCGAWHIDHIVPCSAFDLKSEEQQKKCFHYTNLQPLWAIDNLRKNNKHVIIPSDIVTL